MVLKRNKVVPNMSKQSRRMRSVFKNYQLYVLLVLPITYLLIFKYYPMYGAQIAFRRYNFVDGVWGSPWVGLEHFRRFFNSLQFKRIIGNTLGLSFYSLAASFPIPIILALSLNYVYSKFFRKTVQLVSYAPHFISMVVMVGMILQFLSMRSGFVNKFIEILGFAPINFMGRPEYFKSIFVWTGIWQHAGYAAIIYIAALAGVDKQLHEAAIVDGASKVQRIRHIDIPGILPTAIILLILNIGRIMDVGFEKVLLMQNPMNIRTAEVIDTYVYKIGLGAEGSVPNYSFATAVGLFKSILSLFLLTCTNKIAKNIGVMSLW